MKAIIFDITGVLFPYQPWVGPRPSHEELLKIKKIVIDIYDDKRISKDYLKERIFLTSLPTEELEAVYKSLAVIDEEVFELIKSLSKKYDIYSIANETEKWTDIRLALYDFGKYFKKIYISSEVGFRKPEKEIFNLFLNETGLSPNECLFIDDKNKNIKAAKDLGFEGFEYKNFNDLKKYLVEKSLL